MTDPDRERSALPAGYGELLEQVKSPEVRTARVRAARSDNTDLVALPCGWAGSPWTARPRPAGGPA